MVAVLEVKKLTHYYGKRCALSEVTFTVPQGDIFGFLGPNGGGKTTLFKILSTFLKPWVNDPWVSDPSRNAEIYVNGFNLFREPHSVRKLLGVVFQSPSLDKKLKVSENLIHQGHLYGLKGVHLKNRIEEVLKKVKLLDRKQDLVEKLSGGLQRRVEIAKALLHEPSLLLLDEPTTGLDPAARLDVWAILQKLKSEGVTSLLTTHLIEEAEKCDRVGILQEGKLIALGTPQDLKEGTGGDILTIKTKKADVLKIFIEKEFGESVQISKATLEDVFIQKTGHKFEEEST